MSFPLRFSLIYYILTFIFVFASLSFYKYRVVFMILFLTSILFYFFFSYFERFNDIDDKLDKLQSSIEDKRRIVWLSFTNDGGEMKWMK